MFEEMRQAKQRPACWSGYWMRALAGVSVLSVAAPLGGCGINRTVPPPTVASDYHERHAIALADGSYTVDVIPPAIGNRLDTPTALRIQEFATRYRNLGHGPMMVLTPVGAPAGSVTRGGIDAVRSALSASGVERPYMGTYPAASPELAAPIRLMFKGVKAQVAHRCGDWPTDLASAGSLEGWNNTTYWNFGCANQATLAAQIADPRDLVAPRGETPSDIEMRMRAIGAVRKGQQPDTQWSTHAASISSVGGN